MIYLSISLSGIGITYLAFVMDTVPVDDPFGMVLMFFLL